MANRGMIKYVPKIMIDALNNTKITHNINTDADAWRVMKIKIDLGNEAYARAIRQRPRPLLDFRR